MTDTIIEDAKAYIGELFRGNSGGHDSQHSMRVYNLAMQIAGTEKGCDRTVVAPKAFYLVDLPGYGFAKASKTEQKSWGELLERYLRSGRVKHLLMLVDIRHAPTQDDLMMFRYLIYYNIPYTLVATKADKIAKSKRKPEANKRAKELGAPPFAIPFSSETGEGKTELLNRLGQIFRDCETIEKESQKE